MQSTRPTDARSHASPDAQQEATPVPSLAPALSSQEAEAPPAEPSPPGRSPRELLNVLRGTTGTAEDVEALVGALQRPLEEGETARARADLLLGAMEDGLLAGVRTAQGRALRAVLVEALLALGYPYALEVPAEVLAEVRRDGQPLTARAKRGLWVALGALGAQGYYFGGPLVFALKRGWLNGPDVLALVLWLVPTVLAVLGGALPSRALRWVGAGLMGVSGLGWGLVALNALSPPSWGPDPVHVHGYDYGPPEPVPFPWEDAMMFVPGLLLLGGGWLLLRPWLDELED